MQVNLDAPLPAEIRVGAGTALFLHGTCFDSGSAIRKLAFLVNGEEQPVTAFAMPRPDRALLSYRSGFWGLASIAPPPPGASLELGLRAVLENGSVQTSALGAIRVAAPPEPLAPRFSGPAHEPRVAICMATYQPPLELLRRQLDSIRAQSHSNWVCVISDDCSRPESFEQICRLVDGDPRFAVSRAPSRQGFYANFERALELAPRDCDYLALADQDDVWYSEKLAVLLDGIGEAQLVYSDARIVARDGEVIAPTYWGQRRNNHTDLMSLLVANSVTGAASLFRQTLLGYALPLPPGQFAHYHDHWIALTALVTGGIAFVDRPLYDYVQHGNAALGHAAATRVFTLRERARKLRANRGERAQFYRATYFKHVERLMAFATVLQLRCGEHMSRSQKRTLRRFLALESSWLPLVGLGWRAARELTGTAETLGAEWTLLRALLWKRALSLSARAAPRRDLPLDAVPPLDLAARSERRRVGDESSQALAEKIEPLELALSQDAPPRVNLLIPTIDLNHLFAGYIAKFNLARRLAAKGVRVRLVTVDPVGTLPPDWIARLESYSGLDGLFSEVEIEFGRGAHNLEVSSRDAFIATTWWTAHVAARASEELGRGPFVYLIQEYEPLTFPMGSHAALAEQSYRFEHFALFSSELLRGYFRANRIGVYAGDSQSGSERSASFQNAITSTAPPTSAELRERQPRRLLFYARPESHAARNMFELGTLALARALEEGAFRSGWELRGIGGVARRSQVDLGAGGEVQLELLPRAPQHDYAGLLSQHDVGLALMYTPHPSLVPIEMAAAGMLTVTNTFANKTADELRSISTNLIAAEPTVEGIATALLEAAAAAGDVERRVQGSAVNWSRDWNEAFDDPLLATIARQMFGD